MFTSSASSAIIAARCPARYSRIALEVCVISPSLFVVPSTTAGTDQLPSSQETTIDRHADAIDEISLVRYEEGDEVSDVLGLANATCRDVGQEIAFVLRRA